MLVGAGPGPGALGGDQDDAPDAAGPRQLERDGLVVRTYHPEVPPRVEYEISELGRSLGPLFASLATWSAGHPGAVEEARRAYDTAESP